MRFRRSSNSDIESGLRSARPKPSADLMRAISGRRESRPVARRSYSLRVAFASMTILGLVALGSVGGMSYAANSASHAFSAVKNVVSSNSSGESKSGSVFAAALAPSSSAASDQYPPPYGCSFGTNSCTTGESTAAVVLDLCAPGFVAIDGGANWVSWDGCTEGVSPFDFQITVTSKKLPESTTSFGAGAVAIYLTVYVGGTKKTTFNPPLTIHIGAPGGAVPFYVGDDGVSRPVPNLGACPQTLAPTAQDGYCTNADGSILIYTRHASYFVLARDTVAPSAPGSLSGRIAAGKLQLAWGAAHDMFGVTGYQIRRNGAQIGSTTGTSASTALAAGSYTVRATDKAGNVSSDSSSVKVSKKARPAGVPVKVPAWASKLLKWQQTHAGKRPAAAPQHLPAWYAKWRA